jgi:hypothetical protein
MFERCYSKNHKRWRSYGSRGITVADRWREFENFLADMGPKPTPKHSIDRYPDNDGNYEPGNCRWATASEQRRNARDNLYVEHEGERVLLFELCQRLGLNYPVMRGRVHMGWPWAKALTEPTRARVRNGERKPRQKVVKNYPDFETPWN